jgi:hypothetical protein
MIEIPVLQLYKISTTSDGAWRVTFDLPEDQGVVMAALATLRGKVLKAEISEAE